MSKTNAQKTVMRDAPLVRGVSRPNVGAARQQLAIAVMDVSGSMDGAKSDEALIALAALLGALADPKNRGAFSVAIIAYGSTAATRIPVTKAADARPEEFMHNAAATPISPLSTNIAAGLAEALKVVEQGPSGPEWLRPIVVLMTDGLHSVNGADPEAAASELKKRADLVCGAFGADADFARLERLANTPDHAVRCTDGAALRKFFAAIGTTMSAAARTGQNAAALLGQSKVLRG